MRIKCSSLPECLAGTSIALGSGISTWKNLVIDISGAEVRCECGVIMVAGLDGETGGPVHERVEATRFWRWRRLLGRSGCALRIGSIARIIPQSQFYVRDNRELTHNARRLPPYKSAPAVPHGPLSHESASRELDIDCVCCECIDRELMEDCYSYQKIKVIVYTNPPAISAFRSSSDDGGGFVRCLLLTPCSKIARIYKHLVARLLSDSPPSIFQPALTSLEHDVFHSYGGWLGRDPDSSSSQMYRRGILIHCPPEYSVDIVPPVKEGSSWHYGLRVKPLLNMPISSNSPVDNRGKRVKGYEIHRKWEDCLDLQRILEREYTTLAKARKGKGKKGNSVYCHPQRAASFDSLPTGPDPKTIPIDIHAFVPRLAAKSSLFRGGGNALVQQRTEEFNEFISALFAPGVSPLVDESRQVPAVREWFGFWRRDRDAMRRRESERASISSSTRRTSTSSSEVPPVPIRNQDVTSSPFTSSPLAQTSYQSTPIDLGRQPHASRGTIHGDLATALGMPPAPQHGPATLEPRPPKSAQPVPNLATGFVPIVQRRLGLVRGEAARKASFRNAQFFSDPPTPPLPPLPLSDDVGYQSEPHQSRSIRGHRAALRVVEDTIGAEGRNERSRRATSPAVSSASTALTQQTPLSTSPRSSQTSDWSMALSAGIVKALAGSPTNESASERDSPLSGIDEQREIERMRKMSLSSLSSGSSRRPPPVPPRSCLRRTMSGLPQQAHKPPVPPKLTLPPVPSDIPAVVYNGEEPEFEIVTHTVLNSYLHDARLSLLSSEYAVSSRSGSSVRRSMTPSIASAYSTSSGGLDSIPSTAQQPPLPPVPTSSLTVPTPSTPHAAPNEIILKAVCPIGDSIVLCRVSRTASLQTVRSTLATKFRQAAGVQLDLLKHGFVLGYLGQSPVIRPGGRPGTAGGRPGTAGGHTGAGMGMTMGMGVGFGMGAHTPARSNGRPGTAPGGRPRSSSLSSVAVCADPTHLTLIVTQRDWENAVAKHGEKMTVRVLLAGSD
ncbi:hypothetical protein CTheo_1711 [Ceratobasidium theobromae]|uniref:PX domain-containing protein n=1 Tax=Ceratobasidium theobromae TaxID=1582974 RepID=A0A5N5QUP5_9AGAM|nr:hypothetical protein CTheo_1711 [Ceratobasidium theobromae]